MDPRYSDATIMGLAIGLGAILLEAWVGVAGWLVRVAALLLIGAILCAVQYWLIQVRRK
ncbi:MAG: hypothetical protein WCI67_15070 [Chloroflexales bacterium]